MNSPYQTQLQILAYIFSIFAFGTLGYFFIEDGWSLFESLYMTAITITTVGYGETKPLSDAGRMFTIILIFLGLGSAALFASQLAKTFLERNLTHIFGVNKMKKKLEKIKGHYIVCGFGDIGSTISNALSESHIPFVVIEADEKTAEYAIQRKFLVAQGKATYDATLLQAGIQRASGIVICLGDDSVNMHVSLAARELNPDIFIVTRAYKSHVEKRMVRAGANRVVNPQKLGGQQFANLITKQFQQEDGLELEKTHSTVMGYALKIYDHFNTVPISVGQILEKHHALQVLKIRKVDGSEIEHPSADTILRPHETALLLINDFEIKDGVVAEKREILPLFSWSETYNTNILLIDEQHRKLFELANDFITALNLGKGKESLSKTFDQLIEYATIHFDAEEKLFDKHDYPAKESHAQEHRELAQKVVDLNYNQSYIFPDNVAEFLSSWLKDHIIGSDMDYVDFLKHKMH